MKNKFLPANDADNKTSAKVIEEEGNIPLNHHQIKDLPLGLTETKLFSKRSKWDNKPSKYIGRNRYNEPKAITAKQKRQALKIAEILNEK